MTTNRDLDQSDVDADAERMRQEEYDTLDLPHLSIDVILQVVGDTLDIDPLKVVKATRLAITLFPYDCPEMDDLKTAHGANDVKTMVDLLTEALESSTQLAHIERALELTS